MAGGLVCARRPDAFEDENDVESFNADNDEGEDGDDGYHDDDFHIMVKRNGWGISLSQKTARNIRHCEFQLPSHLYKISQKNRVMVYL